MYVLGISTHISCGSALLKDGEIIAAVNDERLVREKMVLGFPRASINKVLRLAKVKASEIDYVAVATRRQHHIERYLDYRQGKFEYQRGIAKHLFFIIGALLSKAVSRFGFLETLYYFLRRPFYAYRKWRVKRILSKEFKINCPIEFMGHTLQRCARRDANAETRIAGVGVGTRSDESRTLGDSRRDRGQPPGLER